MTDLSNAQLSGQMSALLVSWQAREDQYREWTGGTANGGPNADGRYQLTDSAGITRLVECPALLASTVSGPAAAALAHKLETIVARDTSISEATRSAAQRVLAEAALAAAVLARNQAQLARDQAANSEANAAVHAGTASVAASSSTAAYLGTQADREATTADAAAADADRILAQAAATAAAADRAAINPVQFATRADGLAQIVGLQAALDAKLALASFTWSGLAGKPSTFAPSAHSHVIADTTGLQAALDAKLASASFTWSSLPGKPTEFAVAAHVHDASSITSGVFDIDRIPILPSQVQQMSSGDLTALTGPQQTAIKSGTIVTTTDGSRYVYSGTGTKTLAGSYVLLADVTPDWNTIAGKPSTFAPSAHSHVVADVTGLQAALDAKVSSGSAGSLSSLTVGAPGGTTGIIYLGQTQTSPAYLYWNGGSYAMPSGPLLVNGSTVWTAATFDPATKAAASHSHDWAQVTGRPNWMAGLSYPSAGGEWLRHQNSSGYIDIGPANAGCAHIYTDRPSFYLNKPLFVNNGESVWTSGNFDPGSKLGVSAQAASAASAVTSGLLSSNTGAQSSSLQYWNTVGNTTLNPDSDWWYAIRMGHGDADTYYSGSLALAFFSDNLRFRRKVNGANQSWRSVWHDGNFDPATKANLSGATFAGDVWNSAGGSFKVLEANASRANQVYLGADGDGGYIHSTYGSGGTSAFRVICESIPILKATTVGLEVRGDYDTLNGADRSLTLRSSTSYNYQLIAAGDHFQIREARDPAKVRMHIAYPNGNVAFGATAATSKLCAVYANPAAVPAAGAGGHGLTVGTVGYGLAAGVLINGNSYLQSTRWDGSALNYPLLLQPNGGFLRVGDDLQFDKVRSGMVGVYDAAQTQAIFAMGPSYTLTPGGASNVIGGLYGLAWSYEPNYGGAGNNPQSKPELYHQLLLMNNGVTLTALGQGIWTSGRIECAGNGGWTMGSYANKNRIDYDGSKFRFINAGNANASVEMSDLTVSGNISAAQGSVYTSGGLIYSSNWWRSTGQTGWYNATYNTGIWSVVAGEVRTYNGSKFHSEGNLSSGGVIISATGGGFQNAGYQSGRNRIWSFANSDDYGLSYYQGAGGWSSMDTINFHFGNSAESGAMHKFRSDGVAAHAGDLYVKGTRVPVFTSSTGAPSGGTDGDIHVTY
jgi:hypothetical protein